MTLFLLAFVVGFCAGLATWATREVYRRQNGAADAYQYQQGAAGDY